MTKTITKQEPKLSVRKPGHWRNRWVDECGHNAVDLGDGTGYGYGKYTSAELAEQRAVEFINANGFPARIYIGPVFFPEGDDA